MYKTLRLNIGRDLNFDAEFADVYVKATPVVYLPLEVQTLITELFAKTASLQTASAAAAGVITPELQAASESALDDTITLLSHVITEWNFVDTDGNPLPIPSKIPADELSATIRHNLPQAVLTYIGGKIMEDTGEIPPVSANESVTPFGRPSTLQDPKLVDSLATHSGEAVAPEPISILTS